MSILLTPRILLLTLLTLVAFGSNSILCRLALADGSIDAGSFTAIRLASGAVFLALLHLALGKRDILRPGGGWVSGFFLFAYAAGFSFAYLELSAGTGGLILFGTVQFTMIGWGILKGERPGVLEWVGLAVAHIGLVVLVAPGLHAPSPLGAALMATAGISWGAYSLRGRSACEPGLATGANFLWSVPFAVVLFVVFMGQAQATPKGLALAAVSGAITSAPTYVLWYWLLPRLTAARAAISQLAVPAIVAIAGVLFLGEALSMRLVLASLMMLGGVALAVGSKRRGN